MYLHNVSNAPKLARVKIHSSVSLLAVCVLSIAGCSSVADSAKLEQIAGSYINTEAGAVGELSSSNTLPVLASTCLRIPVLMNNWLSEHVSPEEVESADLQAMESTFYELEEELFDIVYLFDNAGYTISSAPRFAGEASNREPLVYRYGSVLIDLKSEVGRTPSKNEQLLGVNGEYPEFMPSADVDDEMQEFEQVCADVVAISG